MAQVLRQSTQVVVRVGPFVDVGDGFTPETGITLGAADEAELLKAAGAATVDISGATWAAVTGADGWYDLTLTTSHTDTVGTLMVVVQDDSVCLPVHVRFQVIEEAAYDAIYAASASPATAAGVSAVETDTQDIQSRIPAALTAGGNIKADALAFSGSTTAADNAEVVFATDFATNYDTTVDAWRALMFGASGTTGMSTQTTTFSIQTSDNLANFFSNAATEAGSNDYLTAIDTIRDKLAGTGAVTFASLTVSGATTLTGAVSATNASNDVRGIGSFTTAGKAELQQECTDAITAASIGIKKNTQLAGFEFLMVDTSGDPATSLTVTATRSIDGGAFAACANSVTEVSNGIYKITLAAADVNGDVITLKFTATGAKARYITIKTTNP